MAVSTPREPISFPPLDDPIAGVIHDARRRQRKRRRIAGSLALVLVGLGGAAFAVFGDDDHARHQPSPPPSTVVAASTALATTPYMGVACASPNTIACDRLGLSLILRRPALAVQATVGGRRFSLAPDFPHDFHRLDTANPDARAPAIAFGGYLRPAGLRDRLHVVPDDGPARYIGRNAPTPLVHLRVTRPDGSVVRTLLRVRLSAGWG